ncbi:oxidoreductase C-terminal domain-containing protein [Rhodococcus opacus]|uniref:oxidoreductase C-terminal domain-containing protein n=1 Tax=Rhodococcus opacus TaxID=37919 RepID=UPI00389B2248
MESSGAHKLQIAGIAGKQDDSVVHGNPPERKVLRFPLPRWGVTCVESLNSPAVRIAARKIVALPARLTLEDIAIENFDLRRLANDFGSSSSKPARKRPSIRR